MWALALLFLDEIDQIGKRVFVHELRGSFFGTVGPSKNAEYRVVIPYFLHVCLLGRGSIRALVRLAAKCKNIDPLETLRLQGAYIDLQVPLVSEVCRRS